MGHIASFSYLQGFHADLKDSGTLAQHKWAGVGFPLDDMDMNQLEHLQLLEFTSFLRDNPKYKDLISAYGMYSG